MVTGLDRLSPRQRECLRLVYQRRNTKEIAASLGLAPGTVASYITEAIALLGARDRRHAAEILHGSENTPQFSDPSGMGPPSARVDTDPDVAPPIPHAVRPAHPWGPLSPANRDVDNDATLVVRLAWILALAIGLAVGFGSIVAAARALSDVVRASGH